MSKRLLIILSIVFGVIFCSCTGFFVYNQMPEQRIKASTVLAQNFQFEKAIEKIRGIDTKQAKGLIKYYTIASLLKNCKKNSNTYHELDSVLSQIPPRGELVLDQEYFSNQMWQLQKCADEIRVAKEAFEKIAVEAKPLEADLEDLKNYSLEMTESQKFPLTEIRQKLVECQGKIKKIEKLENYQYHEYVGHTSEFLYYNISSLVENSQGYDPSSVSVSLFFLETDVRQVFDYDEALKDLFGCLMGSPEF